MEKQSPSILPKLYTSDQAAVMLKISPGKMRSLIENGIFSSALKGECGEAVITLDQIDSYKATNAHSDTDYIKI